MFEYRIPFNAPIFRSMLIKQIKQLEMPGIELGASHMRSKRSTTELHPHIRFRRLFIFQSLRNKLVKLSKIISKQ